MNVCGLRDIGHLVSGGIVLCSAGAIFGLGAVSGDADWTVVWQIVLSWVLTLPIAAVLSGFAYAALIQIV